jgi:hypothetical protein
LYRFARLDTNNQEGGFDGNGYAGYYRLVVCNPAVTGVAISNAYITYELFIMATKNGLYATSPPTDLRIGNVVRTITADARLFNIIAAQPEVVPANPPNNKINDSDSNLIDDSEYNIVIQYTGTQTIRANWYLYKANLKTYFFNASFYIVGSDLTFPNSNRLRYNPSTAKLTVTSGTVNDVFQQGDTSVERYWNKGLFSVSPQLSRSEMISSIQSAFNTVFPYGFNSSSVRVTDDEGYLRLTFVGQSYPNATYGIYFGNAPCGSAYLGATPDATVAGLSDYALLLGSYIDNAEVNRFGVNTVRAPYPMLEYL